MTPDTSAAVNALIGRRIRQDIVSMHAYAIQDSKGMVKLDAMENPHRLPAKLQAELGQRLGALALNRYPDHGDSCRSSFVIAKRAKQPPRKTWMISPLPHPYK